MDTPESVAMDSVAAGDKVDIVTDIRVGDIVVLVRLMPRSLILKAVTAEEAAAYVGPKYKAMKGDSPGSVAYVPVEQTSLQAPSSVARRPWWKFW
jgi:hypothetical protein